MSLTPIDDIAPVENASLFIENMIAERAPNLVKIPGVWPVLKHIVGPLLGHKEAIELVEAVRYLDSEACFDWGDDFLNLSVQAEGTHNIPKTGPVLLIANHPGGIPDGNAVYKAIKPFRDDIVFFANRDALRICPGLENRIIPVEWRKHALSRSRMRDTLKATKTALNMGRCVVIFPAGRMSDWNWAKRRLVDAPWAPTAVSIAKRHKTPIIPLGIEQHMPLAYYAMAHIHEELRDITLFHGLLRQKGARYRLNFGSCIHPQTLPHDDDDATNTLKDICETLAWGRNDLNRESRENLQRISS